MAMREQLSKRWRKGRPGELRRPDDGADLSLLDSALQDLPRNEMSVIPALQRAQEVYGYLPESVLAQIADELRVPWARVYGVVTFYAQFRVAPPGRHLIRVCQGTACHVGGGARIREYLRAYLGIKEGQTTPDSEFTLDTVRCVGGCAVGPCMVVDGNTYGRLTEFRVAAILERYRGACSHPTRDTEANHDAHDPQR